MVYVQHVFKAHPEQVFLRYFWLFLWLHSGLEICKVIRLILPKTCKFNTHNSQIFPYKSMCYDLFRSDYLFQILPRLEFLQVLKLNEKLFLIEKLIKQYKSGFPYRSMKIRRTGRINNVFTNRRPLPARVLGCHLLLTGLYPGLHRRHKPR